MDFCDTCGKERRAMDYAARENAELPTLDLLNAMYQARDEGTVRGTFNETGSIPNPTSW